MKSWDGKERRKESGMNGEDRELLIRLEEKLIHFGENLDNFFKIIENHIDEDKKINKELNQRVAVVEKIAFLGIGGLAVLQFVLTFFKP